MIKFLLIKYPLNWIYTDKGVANTKKILMAHPHALSVSHLHNNFGDSHEGDKREKMQMQLKLLVRI